MISIIIDIITVNLLHVQISILKSEENRKLNSYDKIRIQSVLKILENYLEKIYSMPHVIWTISRLWVRCMREQSDEPLKKYLIKRNMGSLWPY